MLIHQEYNSRLCISLCMYLNTNFIWKNKGAKHVKHGQKNLHLKRYSERRQCLKFQSSKFIVDLYLVAQNHLLYMIVGPPVFLINS